MLNTVVFGAGSVGNHFAHAARALGWPVHVLDPDLAAQRRMREDIYPARYGAWDPAIRLGRPEEAPASADLVIVGTPPDTHLAVAEDALARLAPRALLIEKPLAIPEPAACDAADALDERARQASCRLFVGYNHRVAPSTTRLAQLLAEGAIGPLLSLDVDFREHWAGIFAAHPWLAGPEASYLGHSSRGGGASGEHSHALDLWRHLAAAAGAGEVARVSAVLDEVSGEGGARWDRQCHLQLLSEGGVLGRVVQDVVTRPPVKRARAVGERGALELELSATLDRLSLHAQSGEVREERFEKSRPDDFLAELRHVEEWLESGAPSPLDYGVCRGSARLHVAAHVSWRARRALSLDEALGAEV